VLETDEPRMDMIDALREEEQPGTPIGGVEKTKSTLHTVNLCRRSQFFVLCEWLSDV
jgi:hypothetical protein